MRDGKAFGAEVDGVVKTYLEKTLDPILARLAAVEARAPERGEKGEAGERGPEGPAGADAPAVTREQIVDAVLSMPDLIDDAVARHLTANPPPAGKDGKDGSDGAPGIDGKNGADGKDGRDGLDVKDLFRADGGRLVAVMSDGTTKDLGQFVGKDGEPGAPGADGFGFDDMDVTYDGEKTVTMTFTKGERVKVFSLAMPIVIDRGVYREGKDYLAGDGVTWAGSFWIAQKDTQAKPETGDDWRLSVKRGRDGKDGIVKSTLDPKPIKVG